MTWTAIGLCDDLLPGMVAPVRLNAIDLALWCDEDDAYHLWSDRCPHRGMRLSHGFVRHGTLACIYHGWRYGKDGGCSYIPAHPQLTPPETIRVARYECQAADGVIWARLDAAPEPDGAPPALGACQAVRSIPVACDASVFQAAFGSDAVIRFDTQTDLRLLIQPVAPGLSMVHAVVALEADRKAASRMLETLRSDMERQAA